MRWLFPQDKPYDLVNQKLEFLSNGSKYRNISRTKLRALGENGGTLGPPEKGLNKCS